MLTALERKLLAESIVRAENRLPVFSVVCEGQRLFVPLENLSYKNRKILGLAENIS